MRVLRVAGVILFLLILAFISIGFWIPEISFQTRVEVGRTPSTVFSVLIDSDRMDEWLDGFLSIEPIVEREDFVGNEYRLYFEQQGDTLVLEEEIIEYVENERFGLRMTHHDRMVTETYVTLTQTTTGTTITTDNTISGTSFVWRSVFALMGSSFADTQQAQYERLSQIIQVSSASMVGQWTGIDGSGSEHLFEFRADSTVKWTVSAGGQLFSLLELRYKYDTTTAPATLNLEGFESGPLEGMTLFGIVEFISDKAMRLDAEAGDPADPSVRPTEFSDSTVEYQRIK